ncbi:MAG: serine hydrolase [Haliea sp.]|nr:serine hydrolase [Haliea sp.]|tara:strand:+ start:170004 stop:171203 length:1200 start_codon:yes stop_codon:yes gene_type:complete
MMPAHPSTLPGTEQLVQQFIHDELVPGVALAWPLGNGEIHYHCSGTLARDSQVPIRPDSIFRIFSMTKPITGTAAMMLIEEGKLGLDQPLAEILPAFADMQVIVDRDPAQTRPAKRAITIRHLLTHTAGFGYHNAGDHMAELYLQHGLVPGTRNWGPAQGQLPPASTLEEFAERLAPLPLATYPGTRFEYSLAIDLLGLVIQRVSGAPFETFLQQRIFKPLGMSDTGFQVPEDQLHRFTTLAEQGEQGWQLVDDPQDSVYAKPALPSGGGGLVSTARDYARFAAALMNDGEFDGVRLLQAETARLARSNLLPEGVDHIELPLGYTWPNVGFGAAMSVQTGDGEAPEGVFGWPGAAGTACWIDPTRKFFLLFLVQYWPPHINIDMRPRVIAEAYRDLAEG